MTTIVVETRIAAPIELCFDLARDVEAHCRTSALVHAWTRADFSPEAQIRVSAAQFGKLHFRETAGTGKSRT